MRGFSLVELSIVLVILGLLTGGILAGQNLIRAAEIRAITTEYQQFTTAAQTFRDKYFAIPGDMRNATDFWGAADTSGAGGECGDPDNDTGTGTQTCNGDGSGKLDGNEALRVWHHLANAGLIEGSYTGVTAGTYYLTSTRDNVPSSKITNALWSAGEVASGNSERYAMDYGNFFLIGSLQVESTPNEPVISPEEAWNIDLKVDDGRPAYGKVVARHWDGECAAVDSGTSANTNFDASYRLTDKSIQCALYFRDMF